MTLAQWTRETKQGLAKKGLAEFVSEDCPGEQEAFNKTTDLLVIRGKLISQIRENIRNLKVEKCPGSALTRTNVNTTL